MVGLTRLTKRPISALITKTDGKNIHFIAGKLATNFGKLIQHNKDLLVVNKQLIDKTSDPKFTTFVGEGLYTFKPTLKAFGTTWSQEEYSHPGFQRVYLRLKSFQRFTETWAILERAQADGLFEKHQGAKCTLRIASVGGGPGYELLALRIFFKRNFPNVTLDLTSLDLCKSWEQYVLRLGFKFLPYNINDGNLLGRLGLAKGELEYVIISYIMIYVSNDKCLDMFRDLLIRDGVRALIMSERTEATPACKRMENRGIHCSRLMPQKLGQDERQNLFVADPSLLKSGQKDFNSSFGVLQSDPTFPNVPFCEHKAPRQAGGHRLGWRPFHEEKQVPSEYHARMK